MRLRALVVSVSLLCLVACSHAPGYFARSEVDSVSHSLVYRFDPQRVDRRAMQADALTYCRNSGFSQAQAIGALKPSITGVGHMVYLCIYVPSDVGAADR